MKQTFTVPEGHDVQIEKVGNQVITTFVKKVELQDLDCFRVMNSDNKYGYLLMKDKMNAYVNVNSKDIIENDFGDFSTDTHDIDVTKITRSEMQAELAKHRKVFDFDNKVLKDLKVRAEKEDEYFVFNHFFEIGKTTEYRDAVDDHRFNSGNYFLTEADAKEFQDYVLKYPKL